MLQETFDNHADKFTLDRIYLRSVPLYTAQMALEFWVAKTLNRQIVDLDKDEVLTFIWG